MPLSPEKDSKLRAGLPSVNCLCSQIPKPVSPSLPRLRSHISPSSLLACHGGQGRAWRCIFPSNAQWLFRACVLAPGHPHHSSDQFYYSFRESDPQDSTNQCSVVWTIVRLVEIKVRWILRRSETQYESGFSQSLTTISKAGLDLELPKGTRAKRKSGKWLFTLIPFVCIRR